MKPVKVNYVNEKELWQEMKKSSLQNKLTDRALYLATKIANGLTEKFGYKFPNDRDDCIAGGLESLIKYWTNFLPFDPNLVNELGNLNLWAFQPTEFTNKHGDYYNQVCPAVIDVCIDNNRLKLYKTVVPAKGERKQTPYLYIQEDLEHKYTVKEVYKYVVWSDIAVKVRNEIYTNESIQDVVEIPDIIKKKYHGNERYSSFAYITQIIKCGMTKQWKDIHKIPVKDIVSIEQTEYSFQNII